MSRQFNSLRFTTRQRGGRLTQAQVTQTNFIKYAELVYDFCDVAEEGERFTDGHVQHVMNILAAIAHVQNLLFETCTLAFFTNQFDVCKKLHFDSHGDVSLAY